ncbi:MAG: glycosyltransferase family 39 protein [Acidobacteriota bacterium]|nr:glycosyltransferase family 39 protein [Acidobacteriota bacterium]
MRRAAVILLLVLGGIRIAATYTTFSETADEPMHLSAGLQVLTHHRYALQYQNPPLPRVLIAFPPWLAGARYDGSGDVMTEVMAKFHALGDYETMLVLARVGTLLFFLLGALATWAWARRELDETTALVALLLFTTQPAILGHSGLATLDVAGVAGMAAALLAFSRWLERPSGVRAAVLGAAWGFAISCKLLCIAYVPIACAAIYLVRLLRDAETRARWRSIVTVLLVPPIAAVMVWAGYGFSTAPASELAVVHRAIPDAIAGRLLASLDPATPIPAPAFVRGVAEMIAVNSAGFPGYAMSRWSNEGWWWYFPLALGLKTTLGMLLLLAAGLVLLRWNRASARANRAFVETMAAAAAILGLSMTTHVDIGIRYILPIYVPLSLAAAVVVMEMIRHRHKLARGIAIVLLSWHLIASFVADPDYLAYFNELALPDPSRYLVDSNLDWGQDVLRLRNEVRRLKIKQLGLAVFGPADLPERLEFPPHYDVGAHTPVYGWVAVSDHVYRWSRARGGWRWLDGQPCQRIGKSIRLCRVQ